MLTCLHVYMLTCLHAYLLACLRTRMLTDLYVWTLAWFMLTCLHAYMLTCLHAYMLTYLHVYVLACLHACMLERWLTGKVASRHGNSIEIFNFKLKTYSAWYLLGRLGPGHGARETGVTPRTHEKVWSPWNLLLLHEHFYATPTHKVEVCLCSCRQGSSIGCCAKVKSKTWKS